jgi:hypothetical protein
LLINNSIAPYARETHAWQGVLHTATIYDACHTDRRVVNSTMVASVPQGTPEASSEVAIDDFVNTPVVRRRGYDKQELGDDG